jgi:hypothetical protein
MIRVGLAQWGGFSLCMVLPFFRANAWHRLEGVLKTPCDDVNSFCWLPGTFQLNSAGFLDKQFIRLACRVISDTI